MSTLAPTLQAFFTDRLARQRGASAHTVAAYRDTMKLLLTFAEQRLGKPPSRLDVADLDADLVSAFLNHLQDARGNSIRTRNARLAAVHSLFRFAALAHPQDAGVIQRVLAIPPKRVDQQLVTYLSDDEVDALLAAPDRSTWTGRRDHALLALAVHTGLRLSELINLTRADVHLGSGAHVTCLGKGRKRRTTPLDPEPLPSCGPGSPNKPRTCHSRCSPPAEAAASAPTPSNGAWPSTPPPPPRPNPR